MKKTKKILSFLACFIISIMFFYGCAQPLSYAPAITAEMKIRGDVLVYAEYIYFANAYKSNTSLKKNDNDVGNVINEALYRVKLNDKKIEYDEETNMPKNVELVLSKVLGSEHTFLYSVDDFIYFTSPNAHKSKDINSSDKFELTTYFRIKTDGTDLKEIYTTESEVSEQTILKIAGRDYLIFVDGTSIVKIELENLIGKPIKIATDIKDAVFAQKYLTENDRYAYFTTEVNKGHGIIGTYLYKIDITGGTAIILNASNYSGLTITPIGVTNGILYFTMNDSDTKTYYYSLTDEFSGRIKISPPVDFTVNKFLTYKSNTQNATYHIFSVTSGSVNKTYCLRSGNINFVEDNMLLSGVNEILFIDNDYVYYSIENQGIYRISILNKAVQTIILCEDFKTINISFDGKFLYFYKTSEVNKTGIYYMHRVDVRFGERGQESVIELVGFLDKNDMPEETEE